jgi:hypothetical protein
MDATALHRDAIVIDATCPLARSAPHIDWWRKKGRTVKHSSAMILNRLTALPHLALLMAGLALMQPALADEELRSGHMQFPTGAEIVVMPSSLDEAIVVQDKMLRSFFSGSKEEQINRIFKPRDPAVWTTPIYVPSETPQESLPAVCDAYVEFVIIPRTRTIPARIKTLKVTAARREGEPMETCTYRWEDQTFISSKTGRAIKPRLEMRQLDLGNLGTVSVAPSLTVRRFDLEKSVREYLLLIPNDGTEDISPQRFIGATAKHLYSQLGDSHYIAFVVLRAGSSAKRYKATGLRRIAVPTADGSILQLIDIKHSMGTRLSAPETTLTRADFLLQIVFDSHNLAQHMKAKTLSAYNNDEHQRDSVRVLRSVGRNIAEQLGYTKMAISSHASITNPLMRMTLPMLFEKQSGNWTVKRSKE